VPSGGWHADANYLGALSPPAGIRTLHPLVLHVAAPNTARSPRFLLSGAVDLPSMWTSYPGRRHVD
jgi:hypothetical protein